MGSPIEELQRREAAARQEVNELRGEIARLNERLTRAEEKLSRLEITRETESPRFSARSVRWPGVVRRRRLRPVRHRPARGVLTVRRSGW